MSIIFSTRTTASRYPPSSDPLRVGHVYRFYASPHTAVSHFAKRFGEFTERQAVTQLTWKTNQSRVGKLRPCIFSENGFAPGKACVYLLTTLDGFDPIFSCLTTQLRLRVLNGHETWRCPLWDTSPGNPPPNIEIEPLSAWSTLADADSVQDREGYILVLAHPVPKTHYGALSGIDPLSRQRVSFHVSNICAASMDKWNNQMEAFQRRLPKLQRVAFADSFTTSNEFIRAANDLKKEVTPEKIWKVERRFYEHFKVITIGISGANPAEFRTRIPRDLLPLDVRTLLPPIPPFFTGFPNSELDATVAIQLVQQLLAIVKARPHNYQPVHFFMDAMRILASCASCVIHPAFLESSPAELETYIQQNIEVARMLQEMLSGTLSLLAFTGNFDALRNAVSLDTLP